MGIFNFGGSETSSGLLENCHILPEVPGKKVMKSFGLVYFTQKNLAGNVPQEMHSIFSELLEAAKKSGANAVVNIKLTSGSYEAQCSNRTVTYIIAYGDAVILKDD